MIDVATGIARILKQEGIEWVSTFPVCRVNNALGKAEIPLLMMRDDRYAVALGDAFSRVTSGNNIGVCTVQGGVNAAGLQVAYAGLAQAYEDGSPVLCITDGVPIGKTENSHFDIDSSLKSVSKWYGYIDKPDRTHEFMRRAFTMLRNGPPGPVIVAVPDANAEYDELVDPYYPVKSWKYGPNPDDVSRAIDLLLSATSPILYVGEGVLYANATEDLRKLAETYNLPVATTLKAKGAFPENHPLSIGVRGEHTAEYITKSDVIISIGSSLSPGRFSHAIPDASTKKIIFCSLNELNINKIYPTAEAIIGDARLTINALSKELASRNLLPNRDRAKIADGISERRSADWSKYEGAMQSTDQPINPYRVYAGLMSVLDPENSFITHDSGNTRDQLSTVYETLIPRGFLGWGNVSSLGFSLPAAMAARIAFPGRQSVAVTGEAGLGYMLGNLEVPVREQIGITVVHISNGGFSGYGPGFWGEGHDPYTHNVLGNQDVNMSKAISQLGLYTDRVSDPDEIIPSLEKALEINKEGKPAYIEFICSQYPIYGDWITGTHGE